MTEHRIEHRIEQLITQLVQAAPNLDETVLRDLDCELQTLGSPLARSIASVLALLDTGQPGPRIDQGIALPALAMACGTLCDPRLTEREHEAARFEIETLLPMPETAAKPPSLAAPDVPLSSLRRRS